MRPRTFVLLIVDQSTSMTGVAAGVRAGVNSYLDDLAADTSREYLVSLVMFSEGHQQLCSALPVTEAPRLDTGNYRPYGNTALLDALGSALDRFDNDVDLGPDDRVLLVLATDGSDNYSKLYSPGDVLELLRAAENDPRWTCIHLAAGHDAADHGVQLGLRHVIAIAQADLAREAMYHSMSDATRAWAAGDALDFDTDFIRDLRERPAGAFH